MSFTLVNVKSDTHKALKELAGLLGISMHETTRLAVMELAMSPAIREAIEKRIEDTKQKAAVNGK